ncbi:hypothetical protein I3843_16G093600 [Carya illinoinensis]|nr:hypothetical protein I3843_16G093600 [Carya illinoinensis]
MAEIILAPLLQLLFDQLTSRKLLEFACQLGVETHLKNWDERLKGIKMVLEDANEKQDTRREVKAWLDDLTELACDMEDVLDEFLTEASQRQLIDESQASTSKVGNLVPSCFTSLSSTPSAVKIKIMMTAKITKINARFNDLKKQKETLKLNENVGGGSDIREEILFSTCPTMWTDTYGMFGREEDEELVVQLLLSDKYSDSAFTRVRVIPIHGMAGIGKTTLAGSVYNNEKVRSFFRGQTAWVCVSKGFDNIETIAKSILPYMIPKITCNNKDSYWLQGKLQETLKGKRFLIVLDDVRDYDYCKWTALLAHFQVGAPGSCIIITTRNQEAASLMETEAETPSMQLDLLSDDACLSILAQHALNARDFSAHPKLKNISKEIVRKCGGLPLVVKTVGSRLRVNKDWEMVSSDKIWNTLKEKGKIVPALMLSYHHLPAHLKRCFVYCSIFPKNYEFEKKQLVLLWMAEDLLQPREGKTEMEELGMEYFQNLLSRSFFQQSGRDEDKSRFLMHGFRRKLAKLVAGDTCFRMKDRDHKRSISERARYSSWSGGTDDGIEKFEVVSKLRGLRTFLHLMLPSQGNCRLAHNVPLDQLVKKLRRLRVLSFRGYCITELPDSIRDLKHLRYLDLSATLIESVPESITTLYNLQTLLLEKCIYLKKLPSMLKNLVNLRHLNIQGAIHLEGMPMHIGKLTCLRTLSNMVVGRDSCSGLKELGSLPHLQGTLCISKLENVTKSKEAEHANLNSNPKITGLSLEWSEDIDESENRASELAVLEKLKPHESLKELIIRCYGGANFPTWLSCPSFPDLVVLTIENCEMCTSLPPIGQLSSLKVLSIIGMANVENVGHQFFGNGAFESLEILHFEDMKEWKIWSPREGFPKLRELSLRSCPKLLRNIPNHLPSLKKAKIYGCGKLVISVSNFPDLCELEIEGSKGVVLKSVAEFSSLAIRSLSRFDMQGLTKTEDLTISMSEELTHLWPDDMGSLQHFTLLRRLRIYNCPKLVSLVPENGEEQLQQGWPSMLTEIEIKNCKALESLPRAMMYNSTSCLKLVRIVKCDLLEHIAIGQLPPTLERLEVSECRKLKFLFVDDDGNNCSSSTASLNLKIHYCPSLEYLTSSRELPTSLKCLELLRCPKLMSIANRLHRNSFLECIEVLRCENLQSLPTGIYTLRTLHEIIIRDCPNLVFSSGQEWQLPANLRVLQISGCDQMRSLPIGIQSHTSLQKLTIHSCPDDVSFPEGGFPTNITSLSISHHKITDALFEWGLNNLTSLNNLKISECPHLVSFPDMMLPESLTSLTILHFPKLKRLSSKGFQEIKALKELVISECGKFVSFSKDVLPASLLKLCINNCGKLESLPEKGVPLSLQQLYIFDCPLLERRCKKDQGPEWRKISHVPFVEFDL